MTQSNEMKFVKNLSFEQALAELEEIVKKMDSGQENLELAINSFERGVQLKNYCEKKLQEAKLKIEKITKLENSNVILETVEF